MAEYDSAGAVLRRYVHGAGVDNPLVWYEGAAVTTPRYLYADHQGSIVAAAEGSGAAAGINTYDAYGVPATNLGRLQHTGQLWMPDFGA